jgi:hypothetical protein
LKQEIKGMGIRTLDLGVVIRRIDLLRQEWQGEITLQELWGYLGIGKGESDQLKSWIIGYAGLTKSPAGDGYLLTPVQRAG